jgi:phage recombination protein Bet
MSNLPAKLLESNEIADFNFRDKALEYLDVMGMAKNLSIGQKTQFLELAVAFKLNPFKREIYAIQFGSSFNTVVAYEIYLQRAEMSGLLDGWDVEYNDVKQTATATVWRKDRSRPVKKTVYMKEYAKQTQIWKEKPIAMLEKVAMAQAMRLAFPVELGKMPYIKEEQWESGVTEVAETIENRHQTVTKPLPAKTIPQDAPITTEYEDTTEEVNPLANNTPLMEEIPVDMFEKHEDVDYEEIKDAVDKLLLIIPEGNLPHYEALYNEAEGDCSKMDTLRSQLNNEVTAEQIKKIHTVANKKGIGQNKAKAILMEKYNIDSTLKLSKFQAIELIKAWEELPNVGK